MKKVKLCFICSFEHTFILMTFLNKIIVNSLFLLNDIFFDTKQQTLKKLTIVFYDANDDAKLGGSMCQ